MAFIDEILQTPSYGWMDAKGLFLKPTTRQLFKEAFSRINILQIKEKLDRSHKLVYGDLYVAAVCDFPDALFIMEICHCVGGICYGYHEHAWNDLVSPLLHT
ncbi:MAG: hypothetical protein WDM78_23120 [Puia sp.]